MMNPGILATRLGEYGTNYLCLGLIIFNKKKITKDALVGLVTVWLGRIKKLSYKDLWSQSKDSLHSINLQYTCILSFKM